MIYFVCLQQLIEQFRTSECHNIYILEFYETVNGENDIEDVSGYGYFNDIGRQYGCMVD